MNQLLAQPMGFSLDQPAPLAVTRLSLFNYRNYADLRIDCAGAPVVLVGANGSGKTNLLEAISLLVPGRGMRKATLNDLQKQSSPAPWGVAAELVNGIGSFLIGTGRDPETTDNERRIAQIDGKPVRNQQQLAEHVVMTWITPDMDRILADGASARRKLIDRLTYSFDPAHAGRVTRYEKAMRERLRLLRDRGAYADPAWLAALEDDMAQSSVAIAAARNHLLDRLQLAMPDIHPAFPHAELHLIGMTEERLRTEPALLVEDALRINWAEGRADDAQSGITSCGIHRTDLSVKHIAKNCPADLCSTGEQKALLIAIMLAYLRTLRTHRRMNPLFLMDDIAAHLDDTRRNALFEDILALGCQTWLSGTDMSFFTALQGKAQFFTITDGRASRWH